MLLGEDDSGGEKVCMMGTQESSRTYGQEDAVRVARDQLRAPIQLSANGRLTHHRLHSIEDLWLTSTAVEDETPSCQDRLKASMKQQAVVPVQELTLVFFED